MRKFKRSIARENMRKAGFTRMNKIEEGETRSPFAIHWKKYVSEGRYK